MKKRDQLPTPVDLMRLPCACCGGKASEIRMFDGYGLPFCGGCHGHVLTTAINGLARSLDMLAGSGDIMACQQLIAAQRDKVFGEKNHG
jgi:hypothetical protein